MDATTRWSDTECNGGMVVCLADELGLPISLLPWWLLLLEG
jgi:hypothetical protein